MKRILAMAMCVAMFAGLAVSTSAAGNILFSDDFTNGFSANNWILEGNEFFYDEDSDPSNPCISAYDQGVICQAEYRTDYTGNPRVYTNCDYSLRIRVQEEDDEGDHEVGLWWRDDFDDTPADEEASWELGEVWNVVVNVDNQEVHLEVEGEESPRATAPAPDAEIGGDWFQLGWKVTPGRMCVYFNNEKVIDYSSDEIAAVHKSPFLLMNGNCFSSFDDIVIADLEYNLYGDNFVAGDDTAATTEAGATDPVTDNNNNGGNAGNNGGENAGNNGGNATNATTKVTSETTTAVVTSVVTNEQGETSIVTSIVTEATTTPGAETNNRPAKPGNATTTGDATFVVIAAMVAALGCAVVVKKVNIH